MGAAVATNQLPIFVGYADHTSTSFTPGNNNTASNSTTPVTIVSAPASSTYRQVQYINIYNADTANVTLTIRLDDSTNERIIIKPTIQPGETLEYNYQNGWRVVTSLGLYKLGAVNYQQLDGCLYPYGFNTANVGSAKTHTSGTTFAAYLGRASAAYTQAIVNYRVTTAAVTITWAEIAIGTGQFTMSPAASGAPLLLTTRGYTDVSAVVNSLGVKTTTISLSGINPGDDLFFLSGNQASTPMALRSQASNVNAGSGRVVSASSTQPSAMASASNFVVDLGTQVMVAASFS